MAAKKKTYSDYGYATATVKSIPELKSLMDKAIAGNWTPQKFEGAVRNTKWWKNTSDSQRQFQVLEKEKPTEAKQRVQRRKDDLKSQATAMGVAVTDAWLNQTARRVVSGGWDENMVRRYLANTWKMPTDTNKATAGQAATSVAGLRDMSAAYGIKMTTTGYQTWVRQIMAGERQISDFEESMKQQAKGKYLGIADDLDRGMTVEQIYSPYKESASRILGINPNDINVADSKWMKPLSVKDSSGKSGMMGLDAWERTLRTDSQYGWENTTDARNQAVMMAAQIKRTFGMGN